ncbi:MAG: xanthine phosphoribosyltransferase [Gammaproteobacteria bacterium]|nr:MAG: xanthine phosphoribosyltransferase [Gammaproteobacteria bacterium]
MQSLIDLIQKEGRYLGNDILKVDSFLNHQVDVHLMTAIGRAFYQRLGESRQPISKILTAEASGIMPALTTAIIADCRMVYARKSTSKTMVDACYEAEAISRTRGNKSILRVNKNYLKPDDRVLIIDDFLAIGSSIGAMIDIVQQANATLVGIGVVIEKPIEGGRKRIRQHLYDNCPVTSLAQISFDNDQVITAPGKLETLMPEKQ